MHKKKRLYYILILCILAAIAFLLMTIWNRAGGVLFVVSAVLLTISVIGALFSFIEWDKVSDLMNLNP
jgi:hypothetical protein